MPERCHYTVLIDAVSDIVRMLFDLIYGITHHHSSAYAVKKLDVISSITERHGLRNIYSEILKHLLRGHKLAQATGIYIHE